MHRPINIFVIEDTDDGGGWQVQFIDRDRAKHCEKYLRPTDVIARVAALMDELRCKHLSVRVNAQFDDNGLLKERGTNEWPEVSCAVCDEPMEGWRLEQRGPFACVVVVPELAVVAGREDR